MMMMMMMRVVGSIGADDLHRPVVRGQVRIVIRSFVACHSLRPQPFTIELVPDRSSLGWQSVMDSRFYFYDVHTRCA